MELHINKFIVVLIFNDLFMGCSTFKEPVKNNDHIKLTSENLNQLNGFYKRSSIKSSDETIEDLFDFLFMFFKHGEGSNEMVELEVINDHRVKVSLIRNDTPIKSKIMRGRLKGNVFEFNRRNFMVPFFPIGGYFDKKTRLRILPNGNLMVDSKNMGYGAMLLFPFWGSNKKSNVEFKKIINK